MLLSSSYPLLIVSILRVKSLKSVQHPCDVNSLILFSVSSDGKLKAWSLNRTDVRLSLLQYFLLLGSVRTCPAFYTLDEISWITKRTNLLIIVGDKANQGLPIQQICDVRLDSLMFCINNDLLSNK